jgi:formate hydrogenlyase subunit 3/multisubunit Na+/H+ antiporter MnhD subunit
MVFFVGFGLKAGFIPLHTWLPHAHPAAPSHISGVMSGVIVKLGIYGILRVAFNLKSEFFVLGEILLVISVFTSVFGIINAAVHRDIKKMLAYCTIENIGIIGIGIGIGLIGVGANNPILYFLGFGGALLHVLNHSLFKSLLFFSAGSVYQQTHTRDMDKLGGLMKSMPRTSLLFLVGSVAIGGLPPFNGFISEFLIYSGLIEGLKLQSSIQILIMLLSLAGLSIVGGLSILTFTKTFGTVFLGTERQKPVHKPHEVSVLMLIPQYFIVAAMLTIAFFPGFYVDFIGRILTPLSFRPLTSGFQPFGNYVGILRNISFYSFVMILLIIALVMIRKFITASASQTISLTWGCGYTVPSSRLQYTGKSFSKSLSKMFNFVVIERKQYDELKNGEIFPEVRDYKSHYHDFFEFRFIKSITNRLIYTANYFNFVQNGRVQSYILYGLVFMLIIFLLTIFNIFR